MRNDPVADCGLRNADGEQDDQSPRQAASFASRNLQSRGVSLIAALFIILALSFMGVIFVSMIGTGSLTAVSDLQSAQALSLAEAGLQYALTTGGTCSYTYPGIALGPGTFTTVSQLATAVANTMDAATTTVPLTAAPVGFFIPGVITIGAEHLYCTAILGPSFTGCSRGWAPPPAASAHSGGAAVTQCVITSTGTAGAASRTVQATVGP
ncbi:MAG: hypothetical protein OEW15_13375 [Nitrospirota bacterium]|nr:hypothetical protein [Nitrospirota bacterium]